MLEMYEGLDRLQANRWRSSGFAELARALHEGILDIHVPAGGEDRDVVQDYVAELLTAFDDPKTHLLVDDLSGSIVRAHLEEAGRPLNSYAATRARHGGLAFDILGRLPTIDTVPFATVVEVRRELDVALKRFRASVSQMSQQIEVEAWTPEFKEAADIMYHQNVAPALADIEQSIRDDSYLKEVFKNFLSAPIQGAGTMFGLAMANVVHSPELFAMFATGAATVGAFGTAAASWRRRRRTVERNSMFFVYSAEKKLR